MDFAPVYDSSVEYISFKVIVVFSHPNGTSDGDLLSHRLIVWVFVLLGTTLGLAFRVNGARAGSNAKQNEDPIRRWDKSFRVWNHVLSSADIYCLLTINEM